MEQPLDTVNFGGNVTGREGGDFGDGGSGLALQVEQDDLAVEGLEPVDALKQAGESILAIGLCLTAGGGGLGFERVEVDQAGGNAATAQQMRRADVVGHAIDPRLQAAAPVEQAEAPP